MIINTSNDSEKRKKDVFFDTEDISNHTPEVLQQLFHRCLGHYIYIYIYIYIYS